MLCPAHVRTHCHRPLQAVKTAVTELYARHVNLVAEDKTVPSDTRPAVSDAEMEKEFGRQVRA